MNYFIFHNSQLYCTGFAISELLHVYVITIMLLTLIVTRLPSGIRSSLLTMYSGVFWMIFRGGGGVVSNIFGTLQTHFQNNIPIKKDD